MRADGDWFDDDRPRVCELNTGRNGELYLERLLLLAQSGAKDLDLVDDVKASDFKSCLLSVIGRRSDQSCWKSLTASVSSPLCSGSQLQ